eukprot:6463683-Amphidinium_carterae.2
MVAEQAKRAELAEHLRTASTRPAHAVLQEDKTKRDSKPEYQYSLLVAGPPRLASTRMSTTSTTMSTMTNRLSIKRNAAKKRRRDRGKPTSDDRLPPLAPELPEDYGPFTTEEKETI